VAIGVIGVLLTMVWAYAAGRKPGVFSVNENVLFLAPSSAAFPNSLVVSSDSIVTTAGIVARMIDPRIPSARVASSTVTLVGEGIRNGWSVQLPNDGGQYEDNFDQPLLQVQVVGTNPYQVIATTHSLLGKIDSDLALIQRRDHVPSVDRIHTSLNPSSAQLFYQTGSRIRAMAAVVLLGIGFTVSAQVLVRRRFMRRSARASDGASSNVAASPKREQQSVGSPVIG
jgi:hypothetical protein